MFRFEVGEKYEPNDFGFDPIRIERRTDKTVWVDKDGVKWRMRIKKDRNGNEYVADSCVPLKWRDAFTYQAKYKVEESKV